MIPYAAWHDPICSVTSRSGTREEAAASSSSLGYGWTLTPCICVDPEALHGPVPPLASQGPAWAHTRILPDHTAWAHTRILPDHAAWAHTRILPDNAAWAHTSILPDNAAWAHTSILPDHGVFLPGSIHCTMHAAWEEHPMIWQYPYLVPVQTDSHGPIGVYGMQAYLSRHNLPMTTTDLMCRSLEVGAACAADNNISNINMVLLIKMTT